jgi:hypothetical protein
VPIGGIYLQALPISINEQVYDMTPFILRTEGLFVLISFDYI